VFCGFRRIFGVVSLFWKWKCAVSVGCGEGVQTGGRRTGAEEDGGPMSAVTTGNEDGTAVEHPRHYNTHPSGIECIEISRLCMSDMGQAIQYIWRAEEKHGLEDYLKAAWFLKDLLANGLPHHPPFKAKQKLMQAARMDDCPRRQHLLHCIAVGELTRAVSSIEMMARP
jgi:hypothetical protein